MRVCVCVCVCSVPVLIRIYTAGPCFNVVSCIAHYCYLPPGWKSKPETNSELCAVKCTQEISVARKSGCVRGVNLRLSQPEATMGCCGKTISSQAFRVEAVTKRWGGVLWWRDVLCNLIQEIEKQYLKKHIIDPEDSTMKCHSYLLSCP